MTRIVSVVKVRMCWEQSRYTELLNVFDLVGKAREYVGCSESLLSASIVELASNASSWHRAAAGKVGESASTIL